MRLEYLLTKLLQEGYHMPTRLKGERNLHMYECLHECLHSFSITQPIGRHIPNMGREKNLINKEVISPDLC